MHQGPTVRVRHPAALSACAIMGISAAIRLVYFTLSDAPPSPLWLHLVLPVFAALLFVAGHIAGERAARWCSMAAVVLGVTFFLGKAMTFAPLHRALCTLLYLAVLTLYTLTMLGIIPTKRLLYPLFGLPLVYHIFVEDMQIYILADPRPPLVEWMPEVSVLCIMAALLVQAVALDTRDGV